MAGHRAAGRTEITTIIIEQTSDTGRSGQTDAAAARRRSWRAVPGRYLAGLLLDVVKITLAVLAGIEAIYLSDKVITHLLHITLQQQAGIGDLARLVLYATPDVLFIAFPVALLIAVYLVLLRRREASELIVFAGIGYGTGALIAFVLLIGLAGQAVSLAMSGFVEPHALHQFAKSVFETRYKALREGRIAAGKFFVFDDYAVFAPYSPGKEVASHLFIHLRADDERYRIVIADRATLFGSPEIRNLGLIFENATVHEFRHSRAAANGDEGEQAAACPGCTNIRPAAPVNIVNIDRLYGELPTGNMPEFGPRGQRAAELTTPELLAGAANGPEATREIATRVVRGLLCFLAPLIALLAVALTRPASLFLALPAACAVVLAGGFFGAHAIRLVAAAGTLASVAAAVVLALIAAAATIVWIVRVEHGCVRPERVRL